MVNIPEKLWELSNIITGFSVVQTIAYLYSVDSTLKPHMDKYGIAIIIAIIVFHVLYMIAVFLCHTKMKEYASDPDEDKNIKAVSLWVKRGQLLIIFLFGVFACFVTGVVGEYWKVPG